MSRLIIPSLYVVLLLFVANSMLGSANAANTVRHVVTGKGTATYKLGNGHECKPSELFTSQFTIEWDFTSYTHAIDGIVHIEYQLKFPDRTDTIARIELRTDRVIKSGSTVENSVSFFKVFTSDGTGTELTEAVGSAMLTTRFYYLDLWVNFVDNLGRVVRFRFETGGTDYPYVDDAGGIFEGSRLEGECRGMTWKEQEVVRRPD